MEVELKPSEIHYLSRSISAYFTNGGHILATLEDLLDETLAPGDIPLISVFQRGSRWYVYDGQRRLYLYRSLEKRDVVGAIKVKVEPEVDPQTVKQKQTSKNGGVSVTVTGDSNFHGRHGSLIQKWSRKNTWFVQHDDYDYDSYNSSSSYGYDSDW